jgi:Flagellar protein FlbT
MSRDTGPPISACSSICARPIQRPAGRSMPYAVNDLVSGGALYKALKEIRKLIKREEELLAA